MSACGVTSSSASFARTLLLTAVVLLSNLKTTTAQLRDDIQFEWNSVPLPFALSDQTATYVTGDNGDEDGFVLLTGGCNATKGNTRITLEEDGIDLFTCLETSTATLKFDPFANTFERMAPMLRPRQRHAAAVIRGELYVIGGRNSSDGLVPQIDSYNPKDNTWTERGVLPEDVVASDLAAWSWKDTFLYVAGGFVANYTAVGSLYRLNVGSDAANVPIMSFDDMQYTPLRASPNPRGDFSAAVLFGYAYMAGGISHQSYWCEAMTLTERYHMESDTWTTMAPLETGRADMAVAALNNKIVSVGGETKPESCGLEGSDPAFGSFPADHVDVLLNPTSDDSKWVRLAQYPDERFRFAAAVVPALQRMYTFGGQLPYDFTCDCFPTSTDVGVGTEYYATEESLSAGSIAAIVLGSLIGLVLVYCICRKCMQRRQKEAIESQAADQAATAAVNDDDDKELESSALRSVA